MNKITRENYEEFILDYADNLLPADLNTKMEAFLNLHPDIASEMLTFRNLKMTPDPTVKFLDKKSLLRPVAVAKNTQFYSRLLKVAAVGVVLGGIGVYTLLSDPSESVPTYSQVNEKVIQTQSAQVDNSKQTKKEEVKPIEEVAVKRTLENQKHEAVAKVTTESKQPSQHLHTVERKTSTQAQGITEPESTKAEVNGPSYQPKKVSRTQDQAQVSQVTPVQPYQKVKKRITDKVEETETKVISSLASVESLPLVESLPFTQEVESLTPQSDGQATALKFREREQAKNNILKSIIKGTRLSQIDLEEISESLIPSFALSEVQFVPTYLKK